MRILVLTNLYPNPFQETKAPFVRNEIRILAKSNTIRVISPISWTDEVRARLQGMPKFSRTSAIRDGIQVDYPRYWYTPGLLRHYYGHLFYRCARRSFHQAAASLQPDLVYAPWAYPDGWAAVKLADEIGVPAVIKVHGSDILLLNQHPGRLGPTTAAVREAAGIVAVSRDLATLLARLGAPPHKIHLNYGGVDRAAFFPGPQEDARQKLGLPLKKRILLFIGNLVPVKNIPDLLAACQLLRMRGFDFELRVIGGGPLRKVLEGYCRQHGLAETVFFQGTMPQSQLGDWYRAADLFVLSSNSEGVPSVLLEASSCGIPFVATRVGGIPEILEWGRGRLVEPANAALLADGIEQALATSWQPGEKVLERSMEDSAHELERILRKVVDQHLTPDAPVPGNRRVRSKKAGPWHFSSRKLLGFLPRLSP
jgi:glycosyltransferase involved in cell wall biosynthesis